jgi:cytochrome o ubiquinol oxidase operon protein cyoD
MSAHQEHSSHGAHGGDHHDEHHHTHASHGSFKSYVTGFVLAVILTAIPFWLVMAKVFDKSSTASFVLLGLAAVQIVVHMIYFLHMNTKSEGGWSMLALVFTVMVVVIVLSGSLWVMFHLNNNMMPGMSHEMQEDAMPASMHDMPAMPNMPAKMQGMSDMHRM